MLSYCTRRIANTTHDRMCIPIIDTSFVFAIACHSTDTQRHSDKNGNGNIYIYNIPLRNGTEKEKESFYIVWNQVIQQYWDCHLFTYTKLVQLIFIYVNEAIFQIHIEVLIKFIEQKKSFIFCVIPSWKINYNRNVTTILKLQMLFCLLELLLLQ